MRKPLLFLFWLLTSSVCLAQSINLSTNAVVAREASSTVITVTGTATSAVPSVSTVLVSVTGTGITNEDYTLSSSTLTIEAGQTTGTVTLTILNDAVLEGYEIARVSFSNPTTIALGTTIFKDHLIFDNDYPAAPTPSNEIQMAHVSSYLNIAAGTNSAEISAYDPASKRLFIANSVAKKLNIIDFSNPSSLTSIKEIDLSSAGGINSVAAYNGIIAVALEATNLVDNGKVQFFNSNGDFQKEVIVGAMPDMITFSPNGNLVLVANEGEPSDDYSVDPEGSVSIINISGGIANLTQSNVTTVNFNAFDSQLATLRAQGIRIYGANNATVSRDFEPEYITFSPDGFTAYVTLQENNAIAELNVPQQSFTSIRPLGLKDHANKTNGLDATDQGGVVNISDLPVKGMYEPDAIASFVIGSELFLVTANEGDSRVYPRSGTATFNEEVRVGSAAYVLDPTAFPNAALLKNNAVLGRLQLSNRTGDTDGDGDFDEIHALGSRSFSIWRPSPTGLALIWDSGDQFERITAADANYNAFFNANNSTASPVIKDRSDNKGPEPEGVVTAVLEGKTYAFVTLERTGGVMLYNITNPLAPTFVQYINTRNAAGGGDLGPEGIFFIPASQSPSEVPLVVVSNEISSTVSVFAVNGNKPAAATALAAGAGSAALSVRLTWTDDSANERGFEIQRSLTENTGFTTISTTAANATSFVDNNVVNNTTYFYRIRPLNDFGYAAFTPVVSRLVLITRVLDVQGSADFGDIIVGQEPVTNNITLSNSGNSSVNISAFTFPAGFSSTLTSTVVEPGAQVTLPVTFEATEVISYTGNITITSNATSGTSSIPVSANGISITAIENSENEMVAFPNPTSGKLIIETKQPIRIEQLYLLNSVGQFVGHENLFSSQSQFRILVDLSGQPDGVYFMHAMVNDKISVIRIIKQH